MADDCENTLTTFRNLFHFYIYRANFKVNGVSILGKGENEGLHSDPREDA